MALIPNCAATRYTRFTLDGSGLARIAEPDPALWDGIADQFDMPEALRVDLDRITQTEVAQWRMGQTLLLSGKVFTARDAAHKRMDRFVEPLMAQAGLRAMIGKAERGPQAVEAIRRNKGAYLCATGGAAYLMSRAIRSARVTVDILDLNQM